MTQCNQDTMPCDHITCINRIPRAEYMAAYEKMERAAGKDFYGGFVTCAEGKCTPAPEGHWLHELATMPIDDLIGMVQEVLDDAV